MPDPLAWAVVVHGGCKPIAPEQAGPNLAGCEAALRAAVAVVSGGGSAVDAVEAAVRSLEADPTFNAGLGAVRNSDGDVEVDAALMDGDTLALGAVAAVRDLLHPIGVARALLEAEPTLLAGEGARRFAQHRGLDEPIPDGATSSSDSCDTVGCVVRDTAGRIAAGTSTGGLEGCAPGRVGDSPLPGCGVYADSRAGGMSASGVGESISRTLLGARTVFAMEAGATAQAAVEGALGHLARVGGDAGLIAIDRSGRIGIANLGDQFVTAWATGAEPEPHVQISGLAEARSDA